MKKTFDVPCGALTLSFADPTHAFLAVCGGKGEATQRALNAVSGGALLKLDAVRGESLAPAVEDGTFTNGQRIVMDGWYGILPAIQMAVGPFERKSQAMNAIVLSLLGLSVLPNMQEPEPAATEAEAEPVDIAATLRAKGVPDDVADMMAAIVGSIPGAQIVDVDLLPRD